ncbi:MAG: putative bifunctional diguanylate cyclase/phosphodiesterase [Candidatus Dormibacteria bacterium]
MLDAADRWSTPRLAEFIAAITGAPDDATAMRRAVDWATEALDAEIGIIVSGGETLASVGFARGHVTADGFTNSIASGTEWLDIAGVGPCRLAWAQLDADAESHLAVARAGDEAFTREEVGLLRAAARSLGLTLRLLRALADERGVRDSLQKRQLLLERLSHIQRSITRRLPLHDVLQSITAGARDLLDVEIAAVRLIDPDNPNELYIAACEGLAPEVLARIRRSRIGEGAGGTAVSEGRVIVVEDYETAPIAQEGLADQHLRVAMAAPVHDGDLVMGSITVASDQEGRTFASLEMEALVAFAEHASLALADAKRVEHIQRLAFHDGLTGLPNRPLFLERLEQSLTRARRRRGDVAVLYLDLDRFKTINDSLGHSAGDELLTAVAARLNACLRDEDTAARLGGDEFAILAHCDREGAQEVAQRILAALTEPFTVSGREVSTSTSIGIAVDRGGRVDAGGMLRDADTAMYRAKMRGSPGFVVFEASMHQAAVTRIDREVDLRQAVARGELRLQYQPVVRLSDGRMAGLEALIRWQHTASGLLSPADFIPLAEETGQIESIGRWILMEACGQARKWHSFGASRLSVSVNVSALQLQSPRFVDDVSEGLRASDLDPTRLILEITESAVMLDAPLAIARLGELHDLGVKLAVDDFGTGYSSLAILRRLPVDTLKVDRLFVEPIADDETAAAFLETVVRLASILSLNVVVEGVETQAQADVIAGFGHVLAQGYHLARPMDVSAIDRMLTSPQSLYRAGGTEPQRPARPRLVSIGGNALQRPLE